MKETLLDNLLAINRYTEELVVTVKNLKESVKASRRCVKAGDYPNIQTMEGVVEDLHQVSVYLRDELVYMQAILDHEKEITGYQVTQRRT